MTTYNDVFTSILAMDSYHKNNNQGVFLKDAGEKGENGSLISKVNNIAYPQKTCL